MTLGTLNPRAEKRLRDVLGDFLRVRFDLIEVGGWSVERTAAGSEQFANHLVQRPIGGNLLGEPLPVQVHRLVLDAVHLSANQQ